jgi:drug/metabolite transporter, DME family
LTALRITIALPMLAALALYRGPVLASGIDGRQVLFLLLVAFVPGLAGLMVYYRGLRGSYASRAAVAELCFPATAVLLNWVFFDTRISAAQGAGFLLLAATMVSWRSAKSGLERETDCATHFEALSDHPLLLENKEYH